MNPDGDSEVDSEVYDSTRIFSAEAQESSNRFCTSLNYNCIYNVYFYRIACCNSDNGISVFSFKNLLLTAQF